MTKYFIFYRQAFGNGHVHLETSKLEDVLALVKKAENPDESGFREFVVIEGHKLEFEPHTVVETYRVKEQES
jgi:hypothetical protein